jgi:iron complex transport system permease protein
MTDQQVLDARSNDLRPDVPGGQFVFHPRSVAVLPRLIAGLCLLAMLLLVASALALMTGPIPIPLSHVAGVLLAHSGGRLAYTSTEQVVIDQLRLPRIIVAALVGMALGVAGATMQALFRNPLADPGIIGVSAGGATGAVLAIALGLNQLFALALPCFAFLGATVAAFAVYGIALVGGRFSMSTLLLGGVAVSAFLSAVISATLVFVPSNDTLRGILFWLSGGLDAESWQHVHIAALPIISGCLLIFLLARDLNLLSLGDDDARALGVHVDLVRPLLIAAASLITGVAVAVSGTIAFAGLVVPHTLRLIFGPDHRLLIPASAVGGALFLVVADTIARTAIQPAELHVGIITAFIGAPFFLVLLIRQKQRIELV